MNFVHHNYLGDVELTKKETKGIRLYNLPNGDWVPSITSVTSFYNRQIFADWRKRVGIEEANRITKKATSRGTDFHAATELYMLNKEINWDEFRPLTKIMFCGDETQSDLLKDKERNGIADFMKILRIMPSVDIIEFGVDDIVSYGLVKEYLLAKMETI